MKAPRNEREVSLALPQIDLRKLASSRVLTRHRRQSRLRRFVSAIKAFFTRKESL